MTLRINNEYPKYHKDIIDIYRIFDINKSPEFSKRADLTIKETSLEGPFGTISFDGRLGFKREFYKLLCGLFSSEGSPWGIITGTKPCKLLAKHDETFLKEKYLISDEKLDLMKKVVENQKFDIEKEDLNLYVNIPFCPTRCEYCSFPTIIYDKKDRRALYLENLIREIRAIGSHTKSRKIKTVYIGGGTPTALTKEMLEDLFSELYAAFDLSDIVEFTVEAGREDTLDLEKLKLFKKYGVTRISINPQSFVQATLKKIGRKQDNGHLEEVYKTAAKMGFIINMDLILGLYGERLSDLEYTLSHIKKLMPDNLTVHTLSIKKGSKLSQASADLSLEAENIESMLEAVEKFTWENAYQPYYLYRQKEILGNFENVGYSQSGKQCLYNIIINEETASVLGLGMTSNSKIFSEGALVKFTNFKNLKDYIEKLDYQIEEKIKILEV